MNKEFMDMVQRLKQISHKMPRLPNGYVMLESSLSDLKAYMDQQHPAAERGQQSSLFFSDIPIFSYTTVVECLDAALEDPELILVTTDEFFTSEHAQHPYFKAQAEMLRKKYWEPMENAGLSPMWGEGFAAYAPDRPAINWGAKWK